MKAGEQQQLETTIAGLEAQRALLGDAVVDAALGPMKARLAEVIAAPPPPTPPAAIQAAQSLRLVTILFTDIVGSTRIAASIDAEDMLELSSGALARLSKVVEAHGGRVLRYTGDGLKAIFGADSVREDDAERAVRCGLALQAEAGVLAESWANRWPGFAIRVGVHSGEVALGGGIEGGATAMGSTVNLAARMEQSAAVGSVLISNDSHSLVRGLFDFDAQAPLQVKGISEPIRSWLVRRARPADSRTDARGVEGLVTRMIGRDAELGQLQQVFENLFVKRELAVVAVVAEPGIGKSRLLHEFEIWRAAEGQHVHVFNGRATPQTEGQPFGLLRDIVARRFGITDDDAVEVARRKMERAIAQLFAGDDGPDLAQAHAHLLGHLIGIEWRDSPHIKGILDDPKQIRDRALFAARQMLAKVSTYDGAPIVLELEDLHWSDEYSLDFLQSLCSPDSSLPLLVLALCRGTLFERRPDWMAAAANHQRIDLRPLDPLCSGLIADELLRNLAAIPDQLRELVTRNADGNPFYMEELVNMLIDDGVIRTASGGAAPWQIDLDRLRATHVPASLTGVLQARLDGLPAAERLILQDASIIGLTFWDHALNAISSDAPQILPVLVERELALPQSNTNSASNKVEDLREYVFKHQMLHQVTYGTVLKRRKREQHGKLAFWLSSQTGLRAIDLLGVTANHFEQAGDTANAVEFHIRAAEQAQTRLAHETVLRHAGRAVNLVEQLADADQALLRWRALDIRERTFDVIGERANQQADIEALDQLSAALGDDGRRAHVAWRRAAAAQRMADWPGCEKAARMGMKLAESCGADHLRLLCARLVGLALANRGHPAAAREPVNQCLQEARMLGLRGVESSCLNTLAVIAGMLSDPLAALEYARQDLALNRETGNRRGEAIGLSCVGCGLMDLGEYSKARLDLEQSLRLLKANGDRVVEGASLCSLSTVALGQGDAERARQMAQAAVDAAVAVKARDVEAIALTKLGNAELALSGHAAARSVYLRAADLAKTLDDPVRLDAVAGLARVALAQGDAAGALAFVEELLADLDAEASFDGAEDQRLIELSCFRVLNAAGDQRASIWLERARSRLQATAHSISDQSMRESFLNKVPAHREIMMRSLAGSTP